MKPIKDHTKWMFAEAILEIIKTKELSKIRITELCEYCNTDRQIFYYHFKDKYDLVAWIYQNDFNGYFLPPYNVPAKATGSSYARLCNSLYGAPFKGFVCPSASDAYPADNIPSGKDAGRSYSYGIHEAAIAHGYGTKLAGNVYVEYFTSDTLSGKKASMSDLIYAADTPADASKTKTALNDPNTDITMVVNANGGLYDYDTNTVIEKNLTPAQGYPAALRHAAKCNVVMFDGHTTSLDKNALMADNYAVWKPRYFNWKWETRD